MALIYEDIECVICNETLVDPRALPCGHSYCGPPRHCLNSLKNNVGGIRCAVCRVDHNLKSTDIKPLYGIREWFQGGSKARTPSLPCAAHENMECTFWCNACDVMVCASCFEDQHDGHPVRGLKKYLVEKIESQLEKPLFEGIVECRENLSQFMDSKESKLADLKLQVEELEKEVSGVQKQKCFLDEYCKLLLSKDTVDKNVIETTLLLRISELDFTKINSSERSDNSESGSGIVTKISVSTQTEKDVCSNSSTAAQNEGPSSSMLPSEELPAYPFSIPRSLADSLAKTYHVGQPHHASSECDCVLSINFAPIWQFPVAIQLGLIILNRNPLRVRNDNYLNVCPFRFHITADAVKHKFERNEQMFRVIVECSPLHDYDELLPPSSFRYGLTMHHNTDIAEAKKKDGFWTYPKFKDLYWYSITYSELLDPINGWIDSQNEVRITLELKRLWQF